MIDTIFQAAYRLASVILGFTVLLTQTSLADTVYYGPLPYPNTMVPSAGGTALTSGGNDHAPASPDGSVRLMQSAIGFIAATPQGYLSAYNDSLTAAASALYAGVVYRYQTDTKGSFTSHPPSEKTDGKFLISNDGREKYDPAKLDAAAAAYRVAIRANPVAAEPYRGLIQTFEERIVANMVLANQHYVDSVRFRLLPGSENGSPVVTPGAANSALARQRAELDNGRNALLSALTTFANLARDPVEGPYLLPEAPFGLWPVTATDADPLPARVSRLYESYVRALALALEIEEQIQRLDYFQNYRNPLTGPGSPATGPGSAAEVRRRAEFYEQFVILAGAYPHVESYAWAPLSRVKSGLELLGVLARDIEAARLVFSPGARKNGNDTEFVQTSFGPHDIPFLTSGVAGVSTGRTYDNVLALAAGPPGTTGIGGALADALTAETEAKTAAEEVIQTADTLKERNFQTLIAYNGRLIELCGSYVLPQTSQSSPDLEGYYYPPDLRLQFTGRIGNGAILVQYRRIEQAETNYQAAVQDFTDIYREIEIVEQGAAVEAGIVRGTAERLARVYTSYGEEFALLDKAAADIQAQTERDISRRQAKDHKKSKWQSFKATVQGAAAVVGGIVTAVASAGTASPLGYLAIAQGAKTMYSEIKGFGKLNKTGKTIIETGEMRANSIERLGAITQQQTRLRAAESAEIALVSADGQARQIQARSEEQIQKLYVKLERLKLNILMAEQNIDLAELELVNLFDKVGYLLEEYQEAVRQIETSPLNRPDFRYIRDYRMGVAEDQFRRAQMWLYLTAKSAQYRFMTTGSYDQAAGLVETILKCRNATELKDRVVTNAGGLRDMLTRFYLTNGFTSEGQSKNVVYSLRDQALQDNVVNRNLPAGQVDPTATFLPVAGTAGQPLEAASDAQWLERLTQATSGWSTNAPILKLRFATSFDPRGNNPLFTELADQLGHTILSTPSGGVNRKGVFVNIKGRSLPTRSYSVKLEQSGVTYLPYKPRNDISWLNLGFPVRVWNLASRSGSLTAVLNKEDNPGLQASAFYDVSVPVFSQFDERSPYCDQWELTIDGSILGSPNWRLLSEDLAKITDIRLGLTVQGFDPQKVQ